MKNKRLRQLLKNSVTIDYANKDISVFISDKNIEVNASVNLDNENFEINNNSNLTEFQENIVLNYLSDLWNDHFSNNFNGAFTSRDKQNALELIWK